MPRRRVRLHCDCGAPALAGRDYCERCAYLDGEGLPPAASALISELRTVISATWETLELEMPGYTRRTLHRAIDVLIRAGRIVRDEEVREIPNHVISALNGAPVNGKYPRRRLRVKNTKSVARFSLAERKRSA